jgi:hypothetical protein
LKQSAQYAEIGGNLMHPDLIRINVRKSAFMQWKHCPKQYEWVWEDGNGGDRSVEGTYGTMFHSGAEQFFKEVNQKALRKCTNKIDAYNSFSDFQIDHPVVHPWFENFKWFEAIRWEELANNHDVDTAMMYWLPVMMELEIVETKSVGMTMHIDRVNRMEPHVLMNVEYKTSKSWYVSSLRLECAFYNLGINMSEVFTDPTLYYAVLNPQLNRSFMERITDRLVRRLLKDLTLCKESIRDREFAYKPSFLCRWCGRLQKCLDEDFGGVEANV